MNGSRSVQKRWPAAAGPGVELAIVWAFAGLRLFVLCQAAVAVAAGSLSRATSPVADGVLLSAMIGESLLLGRWLLRRRSMLPIQWPVAADICLSLAVLVLTPEYLAPADRVDTWVVWAYPVALSTTLLVGAAVPTLPKAFAVSAAFSVGYAVAVAAPLFSDATSRVTTVVNATTFPGFTAVAFLVARFMRNLAGAADAARKRVAELEQDRSRALVHNLLEYLQLDRFAHADDETRAVMLAQAEAKHLEMRSYVDGTASESSVRARIEAVLRLHPALPVTSRLEISQDLEASAEVLDHLHRALDTALANVETHARGASVELSVQSGADHVAVTVHDDGPGFDVASTPGGFGISEVLGRQLAEVGGTGVVQSSPGSGTLVRIRIPLEQA